MPEEPIQLRYESEKYGTVLAFLEYSESRRKRELCVYLKTPINLYDFVDYQPGGEGTLYHPDGTTEKVWSEEQIGDTIYKTPRNLRLDFELGDEPLTEALVEGKIDEDFRDAIENYDGVIHFEKIIGVK